MTLPQDILNRVERVLDYHRTVKHPAGDASQTRIGPEKPAASFRIFTHLPKISLPTDLLDASAPSISILEHGRDALPEAQLSPRQDLRTVATWLYLSNGLIPLRKNNAIVGWERTCPSGGAAAPCELYLAAFAIEGLEPGLYHYSPREFSLRKMRNGIEALSLLKRGRPDLEYLKTTPAAILVSTVFSRCSTLFESRGYRNAIQDAGQMMENLSICGNALGMQTITRMRMTESTARELIGLTANVNFDQFESVQAMVVWADDAQKPMEIPAGGLPVVGKLAPIERPVAFSTSPEYSSILGVHEDCAATGIAVREIRPPLTELSPLPTDASLVEVTRPEESFAGHSIYQTLTTRRAAIGFHRRAVSRDSLLTINRAALRGGTHFPIFPDGPYVGLIRPFWIFQGVSGFDNGIWYYHPPADRWAMLERGEHRMDSAYLCREQPFAADAAAVCFLTANLTHVMSHIGPDAYRLAHLEAGMVVQRLYVGANSLDLGCAPIADVYDDEIRKFLGLDHTGWEVIHSAAIGISTDDWVDDREDDQEVETLDESDVWDG